MRLVAPGRLPSTSGLADNRWTAASEADTKRRLLHIDADESYMTTPPDNPASQTVLALAAARGILRPADLAGTGIAPVTLQRLVRTGALVRLGRGLYVLADADQGEHTSLAAVARRVPQGVVCLLSALRFHGMTTENPFQVWLAIDRKARRPATSGTQLRIVRFAPTCSSRASNRTTSMA